MDKLRILIEVQMPNIDATTAQEFVNDIRRSVSGLVDNKYVSVDAIKHNTDAMLTKKLYL